MKDSLHGNLAETNPDKLGKELGKPKLALLSEELPHPPKKEPESPKVRSFADLIDSQAEVKANDKENEVLKDRALLKGDRPMIWVAQSGIGKSVLTVQEALLWAVGQGFLMQPTRPLRTLICQAENNDGDYLQTIEGLKGMFERLGIDIREASKNVSFMTVYGGLSLIEELEREIDKSYKEQRPFGVVIIDPVLAFLGGDASSQEVVSGFVREGIIPLGARPGRECAFVLVAHTGKPRIEQLGTTDIGYSMLGSSEWTNVAREILAIRALDKETFGVYQAVTSKRGNTSLGWKDKDLKPTNIKIIGHAEDHREPGSTEPKPIYWRELDDAEIENIKAQIIERKAKTKKETKETVAKKLERVADKMKAYFTPATVMKKETFVAKVLRDEKIDTDQEKFIRELIKALGQHGIIQGQLGSHSYIVGNKDEVEKTKQDYEQHRDITKIGFANPEEPEALEIT